VTQYHAVAVEGAALELTSADRRRALPELIFSCVSAALANAGVTLADVDAVTIACEDLIDGRSLSSMITGPAAGAYLRDEIRLSEDGLAALSLAAAQLQSGTFELRPVHDPAVRADRADRLRPARLGLPAPLRRCSRPGGRPSRR
jgi:acetyl-CoA acetyltransferase